jgi:hypothetical protein
MRLSLIVAAILFVERSSAFVVAPSQIGRNVALFESSEAKPEKKPTTANDILAKARKAAGVPDEEEAPKIFEDNLLEDMQQMLLTLEKRARDGPGSVSLLEIEDLQARSNRVLVDMKAKETDRVNGVGSAAPPAAMPFAAAAPAAPPAVVVTQAPPAPEVVKTAIMGEDGPEYDGKGGMGLAQGTANTYMIPGMDEMSPAEYQKALQDSISDRQANRHRDGVTGNRATWDYLNHLSGGTDTGCLKKEEYEKKEELVSDRVLVGKADEPDVAPPAAKPIAAPAPAAPPAVVATQAPPAPEVVKTAVMGEDGPEYDGKGGMGLAQGTANTYMIPGMDEMSPAEYQKALQDSISDRQANRHRDGVTGNRATWDYLNHLSGGTDTGCLKKEEYEKKEE